MPSSGKTNRLKLNRFVGTDKPKMDDFNYDNQQLETLLGAHLEDGEIHLSEQRMQMFENLKTQVAVHTGDRVSHLSAAERTAHQTLVAQVQGHVGDTNAHLSAAEREELWGYRVSTGTYVGDGNLTRSITLNFIPSMGFVYGIGIPAIAASTTDFYQTYVNSGYFSRYGCSEGVSINGQVVTFQHTIGATLNHSVFGMNMPGYTYVYCAFR